MWFSFAKRADCPLGAAVLNEKLRTISLPGNSFLQRFHTELFFNLFTTFPNLIDFIIMEGPHESNPFLSQFQLALCPPFFF